MSNYDKHGFRHAMAREERREAAEEHRDESKKILQALGEDFWKRFQEKNDACKAAHSCTWEGKHTFSCLCLAKATARATSSTEEYLNASKGE